MNDKATQTVAKKATKKVEKQKKCELCKCKKTLAEFHTHNVPICIECTNKNDEGRACYKCFDHKPWDAFVKSKHGAKDPDGIGRSATCKTCKGDRTRLLRAGRQEPIDASLLTALQKLSDKHGKQVVKRHLGAVKDTVSNE